MATRLVLNRARARPFCNQLKGKLGLLGGISSNYSIVGRDYCLINPLPSSNYDCRRHYFLPPPPCRRVVDFPTTGAIHPVDDAEINTAVIKAAEFAVRVQNEASSPAQHRDNIIQFARVVRASRRCGVLGFTYFITLEALLGKADMNVYYAEVVEQSQMELIKWELVNESFSYPFQEILKTPVNDDSQTRTRSIPGRPRPSAPILPSSSPSSTSFVTFTDPGRGRGRGRGLGVGLGSGRPISPPPTPPAQPSAPTRKTPVNDDSQTRTRSIRGGPRNDEETHLSSTIFSVLSGGAGRGKVPPEAPTSFVPSDKPKEENRHIMVRQPQVRREDAVPQPQQPRLSQEEAVKKAVGILSRAGDGGGRGEALRGGRDKGFVAQDGRGGGRGRGEQRVRGSDDAVAADGTGLYLGDDADGEKLSQRLGPDMMNQLVEAFEDMSSRVLPSAADDAYIDALHTNLLIECEPEYEMGDFCTNPDIDEKPPISLRDALEKVKPFLMAYENIRTQQEWEEAIDETIENVPLLKEIVDFYSGPDRVTAKQQQEEMERVTIMLPEIAPASIKRFTNNAVLSLQSNPGWGFDKKCQFMDKLVQEVSQHGK